MVCLVTAPQPGESFDKGALIDSRRHRVGVIGVVVFIAVVVGAAVAANEYSGRAMDKIKARPNGFPCVRLVHPCIVLAVVKWTW